MKKRIIFIILFALQTTFAALAQTGDTVIVTLVSRTKKLATKEVHTGRPIYNTSSEACAWLDNRTMVIDDGTTYDLPADTVLRPQCALISEDKKTMIFIGKRNLREYACQGLGDLEIYHNGIRTKIINQKYWFGSILTLSDDGYLVGIVNIPAVSKIDLSLLIIDPLGNEILCKKIDVSDISQLADIKVSKSANFIAIRGYTSKYILAMHIYNKAGELIYFNNEEKVLEMKFCNMNDYLSIYGSKHGFRLLQLPNIQPQNTIYYSLCEPILPDNSDIIVGLDNWQKGNVTDFKILFYHIKTGKFLGTYKLNTDGQPFSIKPNGNNTIFIESKNEVLELNYKYEKK